MRHGISIILALALPLITSTLPTTATPAAATVLDGRLAYLARHGDKQTASFQGSIRFAGPPDTDEIAALQDLGIVFGAHHGRTVHPARIPFAALPALARWPGVVSVDSDLRFAAGPPLIEALRQSEADLAQRVPSPQGGTLTGRGVVIANLDTGIDVRHMAFFRLTDERWAWQDRDGDGALTPGDPVDLVVDPGTGSPAPLGYREANGTSIYGNMFGRFDPAWDVAFLDADGDGLRGDGPPGFGEHDPTYGERLFIGVDSDGDGRFDPTERLIPLGPSKIRAVRDTDGWVHRRGVDLLQSPGDTWIGGHGTQTAGILAGGWAGHHATTGLAPGAELLVGINRYSEQQPATIGLLANLAWAAAEGADVINIEDGEWIWQFLDGSSNLETLIDELAAAGTVVVVSAGNAGRPDVSFHCRFPSDLEQTLTIRPAPSSKPDDIVRSWPTFLWTAPVALALEIQPPDGEPVALPADGSTITTPDYSIYSNLSVSPRGTRRLDLALEPVPPRTHLHGAWRFRFAGPAVEIHGYNGEPTWRTYSSWGVGTEAAHTVTTPATADSAITVGAHDTRGPRPGSLLPFSGRGPRIDGRPLVDVLAPGDFVVTTEPGGFRDYGFFAGTSAAAPFAAGAAALLKELDPTLGHGRIRHYLRAGAIDRGADPLAAGAGNLSVMGAIARLLDDLADAPPPSSFAVVAGPNPFNGGTTLRFFQPVRAPATVRIFDVAGREVWRRDLPDAPFTWRSVAWDGRGQNGGALASGVYIAHVRSGSGAAAVKLSLVR